MSRGQKGSGKWINIIGTKNSCGGGGGGGGRMNLKMRAGNREYEQFGGDVGGATEGFTAGM